MRRRGGRRDGACRATLETAEEESMSKPTVYVSRGVRPTVLARLGEACETRAWAGTGRCPADVLEKEVGDVAAVLGTDHWTAALMDKAPHLRIIALTAVGFDSVDLAAATERGIIVTNTAGSLTDTVADLVFALMLTVARRVSGVGTLAASGELAHPRGDTHGARRPSRDLGDPRDGAHRRGGGGPGARIPDDGALPRHGASGGSGATARLPLRHPGYPPQRIRLRLAPYRAHSRDAGNDRGVGTGEDEADRISDQHLPRARGERRRADRRPPGGAAGGRRARRVRDGADRSGEPAAEDGERGHSCRMWEARPRRHAKPWWIWPPTTFWRCCRGSRPSRRSIRRCWRSGTNSPERWPDLVRETTAWTQ